MLRILTGILLSVLMICANAETIYEEGEHYKRVTPEVATHADGKIEVVEVFWYGCNHCFTFEPFIKAWVQSKPDNVVFRRVCVS